MTWAFDFLYLSAIPLIVGSLSREGSVGFAHGLSGDAKGL